MEPSQWQKEFHINSEDRLLSRKSPILSLAPSFKTIGILASAIMIIGIIFYVSRQTSSLPDHALPTLQVPEKPFKIKPSVQEADKESLKHKTIYQKLSARQPDEKVEHLLKEPEEPIALPPSLPEDFINSLMDAEMPEISPDTPEINSDKGMEEPLSSKTTEEGTLQTQTSLSSSAKKPKEKEPPVEKQSSITISGTSVKTTKTASTLSFGASHKGTHWVQLASSKTREAVEREWKRLVSLRSVKPLLINFKPVYGCVDMGESEGIRYRLRVGLFSYEESKTLCKKLKEQKVDCIVKKG